MGNRCDQLFTDCEYLYIHTMKSKKEAGNGLQNFTEDVGISYITMRNNTGKQTGQNTEYLKLINKYRIGDRTSEPQSPWMNLSKKPYNKTERGVESKNGKVTGEKGAVVLRLSY